MQNVAEVFALWPSDAHLVRDLAVPYQTVAAWKQRGSIPVAYWRDLLRAAWRRGHRQLTADVLVDLHAREPLYHSQLGFAEDGAPAPAPPATPAGDDQSSPENSGHFTRWKHLRRSHFASIEEINEHIRALREEWDRR